MCRQGDGLRSQGDIKQRPHLPGQANVPHDCAVAAWGACSHTQGGKHRHASPASIKVRGYAVLRFGHGSCYKQDTCLDVSLCFVFVI